MIIYKATNKVTGKMYVGQTIHGLEQRKRGHIYTTRVKKDATYFHNAIRKYGADNFSWKIIHTCRNMNELNELEIFYIGFYNTFKNGYNMNIGGFNALLRSAIKGDKHPNWGKHLSEETRKRISTSNIGKCPTEESRKKMSLAQSGNKHRMYGKHHTEDTIKKMKKAKTGDAHPMYGRHQTEEAKKKMSEARQGNQNALGYHHTENAKKRIGEASKGNQYSTRAVIIKNKYFGSLQKSADFIGVTPKVIRYRIQHKTKWQDYNYA